MPFGSRRGVALSYRKFIMREALSAMFLLQGNDSRLQLNDLCNTSIKKKKFSRCAVCAAPLIGLSSWSRDVVFRPWTSMVRDG